MSGNGVTVRAAVACLSRSGPVAVELQLGSFEMQPIRCGVPVKLHCAINTIGVCAA